MSVIAVNKISSQQTSGPRAHDRTYASTYQVITDQADDGPVRLYIETQVAGDLHLPQVGEFYVWGNESDSDAYMLREP